MKNVVIKWKKVARFTREEYVYDRRQERCQMREGLTHNGQGVTFVGD